MCPFHWKPLFCVNKILFYKFDILTSVTTINLVFILFVETPPPQKKKNQTKKQPI